MQGPLTLALAKQQADRLIARLSELGITLKRTQALEGVAAIHDAHDWNRLSAALKTDQSAPAILPTHYGTTVVTARFPNEDGPDDRSRSDFMRGEERYTRFVGKGRTENGVVQLNTNDKARLKALITQFGEPSIIQTSNKNGLPVNIRVKTKDDDITLKAIPRDTVIIAHPGAATTAALTLHLLAHLSSRSPGLAVWVMPRTVEKSPQDACLIPDKYASQVEFISVPFFGLNSLHTEIDPPIIKPGTRAIVITLASADIATGKPMNEAGARQMRACRGAAIALTLDHIVSSEQAPEITLLLINEGHLIEFSPAQLIAIHSSSGKTTGSIIASQAFDHWMKHFDLVLPEGVSPYPSATIALNALPEPRLVFMAHPENPAQDYDAALPCTHQTRMFTAISTNIAAQTSAESLTINDIPEFVSTLISELRKPGPYSQKAKAAS